MLRDIVIALAAGLVWAAVLEILDATGWHPDHWLAGLIAKAPSVKAQKIAFWSLVAFASLLTVLLASLVFPASETASSGNSMGDIRGNGGIVTQGQHGDNTISK
jgi:hypothetical protein